MDKFMKWLAKELREALPAMIFFFVAFQMLLVTKATVLADYELTPERSTLAVISALIVTKVILIVDKLRIAKLFSSRMLYNILWKALIFCAVTIVFRVIEESIPLIRQHGDVGSALSQLIGETSWAHFWVVQMWVFALLFFYCLAAELVHTIGPAQFRAMLHRPKAEHR